MDEGLKYLLHLLVFFACEILPVRGSLAVTEYGNFWFRKTEPSSLLPYFPDRITSSVWDGVSDILTCASLSARTFPLSQGFLYSAVSRQCCPILRLEVASAPGAYPVQPPEGNLYLTADLCNNDFQIMGFGSTGDVACLRYFDDSPKNYEDASTHCTSLGAYLVSVKTFKKLQLIRSLVTQDSAWVGMDDRTREGVHVWAIDGTVLTNQQIRDVFDRNEPNDSTGGQDCMEYKISARLLNDDYCYKQYDYVCEKILPTG
ncbi:C-type lectin-related protein 4, partial [Elysia marginata]